MATRQPREPKGISTGGQWTKKPTKARMKAAGGSGVKGGRDAPRAQPKVNSYYDDFDIQDAIHEDLGTGESKASQDFQDLYNDAESVACREWEASGERSTTQYEVEAYLKDANQIVRINRIVDYYMKKHNIQSSDRDAVYDHVEGAIIDSAPESARDRCR